MLRSRRLAAAGVPLALVGTVLAVRAADDAGPSAAAAAPRVAGCPVFPRDNPWNRRVDRLPVAPGSDAIVRAIGADESLHASFGSGRYEGASFGLPYVTVPRNQRRVRVRFQFASESDRGRYPIPRDVPIEGGRQRSGDRHAIVVDRARCRLYELYRLFPPRSGQRVWRAGSGAIWNLRSNRLRPRGWTSADAAGLPILPGLARYEELRRGGIRHALRVTVHATRAAFVHPARHYASDRRDPDLPPMGLRLRLKASVDVSRFGPQARAVLTALRRYGMLVADNGGDWFLSGAPSPGWDNEDLHGLLDVHGGDFEVVDTRSLPRAGG